MKIFYRCIAFVLVFLIFLIVLFNISNTIILETSFISLRANVGLLIFFCATVGSLSTVFLLMSLDSFSRDDKDKFKKQIETAKLNYEIEFEKVRQLEAKIKTLEEALKLAMKK